MVLEVVDPVERDLGTPSGARSGKSLAEDEGRIFGLAAGTDIVSKDGGGNCREGNECPLDP